MAYSLDALLANLGATFDYHFGDASGHLTELIAGQNTTSETALTYGAKGLASVPYSAVTFNGTTSIATAPSNAAFNLGDGPFFLLAAFKPADIGTNRVLIDRGHTTANGYMLLRGTDNTYRLVDSSAGTIIARTGVVADTSAVHTLIATKNGATSKVYWDGADVTVVGTNVTLGNATDALSLGAQSGFAFFSGTIYRLSGGTVALTATQAKVLSDLVLSQPFGASGLVPHFPQVGPPPISPNLRSFTLNIDVAAATNAAAGNAPGTGAAQNANIAIAPNAGAGTGTGAANAPTPSVAPNAGNGAGTGAAGSATTSIKPTGGVASGTGAANTPGPSIATSSGGSAGTGQANAPAPAIAVGSGAGAGTGAANAPSKTVAPNAGAGTGTGVAADPGKTVAPTVGAATGTGSAFQPTIITGTFTNAAAGLASGTGTAWVAADSIAVAAQLAAATGLAYDATITAVSGTPTVVTGGRGPVISTVSYPGTRGGASHRTPGITIDHPKPGA